MSTFSLIMLIWAGLGLFTVTFVMIRALLSPKKIEERLAELNDKMDAELTLLGLLAVIFLLSPLLLAAMLAGVGRGGEE